MKSIVIASAIAAFIAAPTANAQVVVSSDCRLSRFIEAYAWQAVDDAERNRVSQDLINGLRTYLRTVQGQTRRICTSA
jgi:hypothetical protein